VAKVAGFLFVGLCFIVTPAVIICHVAVMTLECKNWLDIVTIVVLWYLIFTLLVFSIVMAIRLWKEILE